MSVRPRDLLFYAGGECLQRFGTLAWRPRLAHDVVPTHTRSGTVGSFIGSDGILRSASANRPRIDWPLVDGVRVPSYLGGGGRTNLVDSDDISAWTGAATVTSGVSDPAGGTDAYTVEDDDGTVREDKLRNVTFAADGVKAGVVSIRENTMPASGPQRITLNDSSVGDRLSLDISGWVGGEPTVTASVGTLLGKRKVHDGYWELYFQTASVTAANTNRVFLLAANSAAETGAIDVYRVNVVDERVPYMSIMDASDAPGDDALVLPFTAAPQEHSGYMSFQERGAILNQPGVEGVILLVGTSGSSPRLDVLESGGTYRLRYHDGSASYITPVLSASPSLFDDVELHWQFAVDDDENVSLTLNQSIGGATAVTATLADAGTLAAAFASEDLRIVPPTSSDAHIALRNAKIASGTHSLADMRAVFPGAAS